MLAELRWSYSCRRATRPRPASNTQGSPLPCKKPRLQAHTRHHHEVYAPHLGGYGGLQPLRPPETTCCYAQRTSGNPVIRTVNCSSKGFPSGATAPCISAPVVLPRLACSLQLPHVHTYLTCSNKLLAAHAPRAGVA